MMILRIVCRILGILRLYISIIITILGCWMLDVECRFVELIVANENSAQYFKDEEIQPLKRLLKETRIKM